MGAAGADERLRGAFARMSISPVSSLAAVLGLHSTQNQGSPKQKASSTQEPTDTVQLSPQALAHLKGADADGDGDGH